MQEWINNILSTGEFSFTVIIAAFLLGLVGTFTSCCDFAIIGAVASYSGASSVSKKSSQLLMSSIFFLAGMILSLAVVGTLTGLASSLIGNAIGSYWKILAGLISIFFGLLSLNILPFKIPSLKTGNLKSGSGVLGAFIFGLAIGGISTGCNTVCNPVFPLILGAAFLKGSTVFGFLLLVSFGLGYGLPMAAAMFGIGLGIGKASSAMSQIGKYLSVAAGIALIVIGFYFLWTF